jgi:diguanylate cyclase (GGDEF)-like protein
MACECLNLDSKVNLCSSVLHAVNVGTLVLDPDMKIVVWNKWMENYSFVPEADALGKQLAELFPELQTGRLTNAIQSALVNRLPSLLSQTLNKAPLPLYANTKDAEARQRMQQAIQVIPIVVPNMPVHCLVQITDVSNAVNRESILRHQAVELRSKTYLDGLTGIPNRRRFDEHAEEVLRLAKRNCTPLSLIMIDIDFFKQYNDRYGHLTGDQCLIEVADALAKVPKRPLDLVARWGGEEFIVLLHDTPESGAKRVAENMLDAVNKLSIPHAVSQVANHVSISLGVATCPSVKRVSHLNDIIRVADLALYEAKQAGRMRVLSRIIDLDVTT